MSDYQDPATIRRLILHARTIAVVGLSGNDLRPSNFVGYYLKRHGYRVVPVNPREAHVLGERSYPNLADVPDPIDIVDVFRDPESVPQIARDAVEVGAGAMWLQFGVISDEGALIAHEGGLDVVMDRCMKIEHARFLGRMHWLGFNTGAISGRR